MLLYFLAYPFLFRTTYISKGIGLEGGFDSAVLIMLFELGWIGVIPYTKKPYHLCHSDFRSHKKVKDIFASIINAIVIELSFI